MVYLYSIYACVSAVILQNICLCALLHPFMHMPVLLLLHLFCNYFRLCVDVVCYVTTS